MQWLMRFGSPKNVKLHDYVVPFFLGGAVTVATGLIAKTFGPVTGGLFLALPAIFPASATLLTSASATLGHRPKPTAAISQTIVGSSEFRAKRSAGNVQDRLPHGWRPIR
jgi:hypothetical protein